MDLLQGRDLPDVWVFVRVVEAGSFSEAARRMGTTKASASKAVARLEKTLATRLLNRSTRKLGLTEAGRAIFQHAQQMTEQAQAIDALAAGMQAGPGGTLRVSASMAFGSAQLAGLLPDFQERYPDIRVVLTMTDRYVDLVEEGIDVALRFASRIDLQGAVARPIAPLDYVLVAAPAYLDRYGRPAAIEELQAHRCLCFGTTGAPVLWEFDVDGARARAQVQVKVDGIMSANSSPSLRMAMLSGGGIALLPTFVVGDDIRRGAAVQLLPQMTPIGSFGDRIFAVYLENRFLPPKVRVFIDYLLERIGERPYWDDF